ncbi:tetraspanin-CD63 receptor [Schistosoma japonicum]|nr:tetraspanin-CD63 receptor [Schistosoma japonicum]
MHSTVRRVFHILNLICVFILLSAFICFVVLFWTKAAVKIVEPTLRKMRIKLNDNVIDDINRILRTFIRPVTLPLMAISLVFICIYLFGVLIAFNRSSTFFLLYEVTLTVCTIVHIVWISLLLKNPESTTKSFEINFEKHFRSYKSIKSHDGASLFIAVVMIELKCCGFLDLLDFNEMKLVTQDVYDGQTYDNVLMPIPCCKMNDKLKLIDTNCPITNYATDNDKAHHTKGCKEPFGQKAFRYISDLAFISITLVILNITLVVCVVLVLRELWIYI